VCASIAEHPIGMLRRLRFRVTVNTDNRLMSDTSMTNEMMPAPRGVRMGPRRLRVAHHQRHEVGVRAVPRAARIINGLIKPRYALLNAEQSLGAI
jgi:adenosine deaminase